MQPSLGGCFLMINILSPESELKDILTLILLNIRNSGGYLSKHLGNTMLWSFTTSEVKIVRRIPFGCSVSKLISNVALISFPHSQRPLPTECPSCNLNPSQSQINKSSNQQMYIWSMANTQRWKINDINF